MSDPDPGEIARRLRARTDTVLIRSTRGNSSVRLHLPDGDAALCSEYDREGDSDLREVDLAVYPAGYYPWCSRCARAAFDDLGHDTSLSGELVHPGVAADGGGGGE